MVDSVHYTGNIYIEHLGKLFELQARAIDYNYVYYDKGLIVTLVGRTPANMLWKYSGYHQVIANGKILYFSSEYFRNDESKIAIFKLIN